MPDKEPNLEKPSLRIELESRMKNEGLIPEVQALFARWEEEYVPPGGKTGKAVDQVALMIAKGNIYMQAGLYREAHMEFHIADETYSGLKSSEIEQDVLNLIEFLVRDSEEKMRAADRKNS